MNKEELETNKAALELLLSENSDKCTDYKTQVSKIDQELKDLGKLELTSVQFDDIYEAVEAGVQEFDFSDTDNFEIEYGIDYDGRVNCDTHDFRNNDDLVQMVHDKICRLFKETEEKKDK